METSRSTVSSKPSDSYSGDLYTRSEHTQFGLNVGRTEELKYSRSLVSNHPEESKGPGVKTILFIQCLHNATVKTSKGSIQLSDDLGFRSLKNKFSFTYEAIQLLNPREWD